MGWVPPLQLVTPYPQLCPFWFTCCQAACLAGLPLSCHISLTFLLWLHSHACDLCTSDSPLRGRIVTPRATLGLGQIPKPSQAWARPGYHPSAGNRSQGQTKWNDWNLLTSSGLTSHPHITVNLGEPHHLLGKFSFYPFFFLQSLRTWFFHILDLGEGTRIIEDAISFEMYMGRWVLVLRWASLGPQLNLPIEYVLTYPLLTM